MQPVASESKEIICSLAEAVQGVAPFPWLGAGLQFPPIPESLELKTVPGVCHEEMTVCFCNTEGSQGLAIRWPTASESRAGASLVGLPDSSFQWEMRDPQVCWAPARPWL